MFSEEKKRPYFHERFLRLTRLDIFEIDDTLEYLARARRGDHAAIVCALRFVYDHEYEIFRGFDGEKAHERGNVFSRGDPAVLVFLRRTCISFYLCKLGNKNIENPL